MRSPLSNRHAASDVISCCTINLAFGSATRLTKPASSDNHSAAATPDSHPDCRCFPIQIGALHGLLRQSMFGRLAGYEDVNHAERLCRDPAMRWVVRDRAITESPTSASQMGRFETKWLSHPELRIPGEVGHRFRLISAIPI